MQPSLAAKPGATLAYRKGWRLIGPANCVTNIIESNGPRASMWCITRDPGPLEDAPRKGRPECGFSIPSGSARPSGAQRAAGGRDPKLGPCSGGERWEGMRPPRLPDLL